MDRNWRRLLLIDLPAMTTCQYLAFSLIWFSWAVFDFFFSNNNDMKVAWVFSWGVGHLWHSSAGFANAGVRSRRRRRRGRSGRDSRGSRSWPRARSITSRTATDGGSTARKLSRTVLSQGDSLLHLSPTFLTAISFYVHATRWSVNRALLFTVFLPLESSSWLLYSST